MTTTAINYMDIDLVVDYDFQAGEPETRQEPGCEDSADINSVCVADVDITNLIGDDHLCRIAERVAADHEQDKANEHADYLIGQMQEVEA